LFNQFVQLLRVLLNGGLIACLPRAFRQILEFGLDDLDDFVAESVPD
jgi:hypothetical protein